MNKIILFLVSIFFCPTLGTTQADTIYAMGLPSEPDKFYETLPLKAPLTRSAYDIIPSSASIKQYAPEPKSQGQYGTCAAWATAYAARTILEAQKHGWTDKEIITKNAFSPGFTYRLAEPYKWDCWGAYPSVCIDKMVNIGAVKTGTFDDPCPQYTLNHSLQSKGANNKIEGYARLWDSYENRYNWKIQIAKKSLSEGNPVVISMLCPKSFHKVGFTGLWIPTETTLDPNHGRHAMCVVGYDDNKYGGAFEVQNSWGVFYGDGGYVWIKYDDFAKFVYQAFELFQFQKLQHQKPQPPNPQPPKPQPPKQEEIKLSGSLTLQKDDGSIMSTSLVNSASNFNFVQSGRFTYQLNRPTISGTRFRIYLNNSEPAYVYLLGTGSINKHVAVLFPFSGFSPALNYQSNQVAIPNEDYYIELDNTKGKDFLILLYSKKFLDIENICRKMESGSGDIASNLRNALGNQVINPEDLTFEQNEIKFKATSKNQGKMVVPIIIMFDHI